MEAFVKHHGIIATLDRANVDTDAIIPKQFLKSVKRTGFGKELFFDARYLPDGSDNPDFILNEPRFKDASILVARNNFGCGSSREHAVWAIVQYGFKVVIAPQKEGQGEIIPAFADIFRNNSTRNGLLTVELSEAEVEKIFQAVAESPGLEATVDLRKQRIALNSAESETFQFEIEPGIKDYLLRGLDDISRTLEYKADIEAFEAEHNVQLPD